MMRITNIQSSQMFLLEMNQRAHLTGYQVKNKDGDALLFRLAKLLSPRARWRCVMHSAHLSILDNTDSFC